MTGYVGHCVHCRVQPTGWVGMLANEEHISAYLTLGTGFCPLLEGLCAGHDTGTVFKLPPHDLDRAMSRYEEITDGDMPPHIRYMADMDEVYLNIRSTWPDSHDKVICTYASGPCARQTRHAPLEAGDHAHIRLHLPDIGDFWADMRIGDGRWPPMEAHLRTGRRQVIRDTDDIAAHCPDPALAGALREADEAAYAITAIKRRIDMNQLLQRVRDRLALPEMYQLAAHECPPRIHLSVESVGLVVVTIQDGAVDSVKTTHYTTDTDTLKEVQFRARQLTQTIKEEL